MKLDEEKQRQIGVDVFAGAAYSESSWRLRLFAPVRTGFRMNEGHIPKTTSLRLYM